MPEFTPSRRSVIRTAAWSVPAITVATAAPAFAASSPGSDPVYTTVTKDFLFSSTNTLGTFDIPVTVVAENVPVLAPAGATLLPITTTSTVTIPAQVAQGLAYLILGDFSNPAAKIGGTSESTVTLSGAINEDRTTDLTIPTVPYVTGQPLITIASGTSDSLVLPAGATGQVTMTIGSPKSILMGYNADDTSTGKPPYNSVLDKLPGEDYTLAVYTIE
ncbi:hypothetical protein IEQ44_14525 [Nocardioides sp. Y6]|uniref:DUF6801 domain-containing protein n=1 Tax=Nocardioides malaquae TaxID=2773426 RepID=A0ABR9RWX0_9ACTN|nr:DUF6801 domain-containing protein [Nocardioides malaquae]MBE7325865.1 hypothetical protein [Nocardioides malaquae]